MIYADRHRSGTARTGASTKAIIGVPTAASKAHRAGRVRPADPAVSQPCRHRGTPIARRRRNGVYRGKIRRQSAFRPTVENRRVLSGTAASPTCAKLARETARTTAADRRQCRAGRSLDRRQHAWNRIIVVHLRDARETTWKLWHGMYFKVIRRRVVDRQPASSGL